MHPVRLAISLFIFAALNACGDAASPGKENSTGPAASSAPGPWDILAALPPETRPYGLDVYTAQCAGCHGRLGQGEGKNPPITELTPTAMQHKLLDYRSGKTEGTQAATKSRLSDADIAAVSIYAGN